MTVDFHADLDFVFEFGSLLGKINDFHSDWNGRIALTPSSIHSAE